MKAIFTSVLFVSILVFSAQTSAQYSNATLNGAWYGRGFEPDAYLIFDGNGNIKEIGAYGGVIDANVGTYTVTAAGLLSANLKLGDETYPLTGQFITSDSISVGSSMSMLKIPSMSSLSGTWSGGITNSDFAALNITIDNQGSIINPSSWSGHIFERNGVVVGFFETDNTSNCWYRFQIQNCKIANNIITGTAASDCRDNKGQINLTRANSTKITHHIMNEFNVYPNPAADYIIVENTLPSIIYILNIQGTQLKNIVAYETKTKIDLSSFPDGIYLLKIKTEKLNSTFKFIKNNSY